MRPDAAQRVPDHTGLDRLVRRPPKFASPLPQPSPAAELREGSWGSGAGEATRQNLCGLVLAWSHGDEHPLSGTRPRDRNHSCRSACAYGNRLLHPRPEPGVVGPVLRIGRGSSFAPAPAITLVITTLISVVRLLIQPGGVGREEVGSQKSGSTVHQSLPSCIRRPWLLPMSLWSSRRTRSPGCWRWRSPPWSMSTATRCSKPRSRRPQV